MLFPLKRGQLELYVQEDGVFEEQLGLKKSSSYIDAELREAIEKQILPRLIDSPDDIEFQSLWSIVLKDEMFLAGDFCFMGPPDNKGVVEIGYGIKEEFRNRGLMFEAINAVLSWLRDHHLAKVLQAKTHKDNIASVALLRKLNFGLMAQNEEILIFEREL